ncbi:hypothetical protein SUGI_0322620 [Cryptomeria japonica]|uniref:trans-Golgi network-localized SYP41-interacting protein 1 n=1 Tax=Cryptomeria japonica TaxID=3369 RepID=UPI002408D3D4|nr:trans-Golgi network-localized SYP41-interacting protein 1 [Cryptomeria japonica]GLJ18240.1 hypothetical protein SUGI_0322620 [Cryptomeria japonica]
MDSHNNRAGGKKKKKRGEKQKKYNGESGVQSFAGGISSGEQALELGDNNTKPETNFDVALGLSGGNEDLESQGRGREGVVVMEPQPSDDAENQNLVVDDLSKDATASHRCNECVNPASDEEKVYNNCNIPGEGESGNAISLPHVSSELADNKELSLAEGVCINIGTVQDFVPKQEEAIGNSSASGLANDEENMSSSFNALHEQAKGMLSPKGINFELANSKISPAHDSEDSSAKLFEGSDLGDNMEEKIPDRDKLSLETQGGESSDKQVAHDSEDSSAELSEGTFQDLEDNTEEKISAGYKLASKIQVVATSDLDLQQNVIEELQGPRQVSVDKPPTSFSVGKLQSSFGNSLHFFKDGRNRKTSVDESFVDALDQLTESRTTSLEESAFVMENDLLDKEQILIEFHACKDALLQANEEKMQFISKLNSYQMQVEKLKEEKLSLAVKFQDAAGAAVLENKSLLEQEPLEQVLDGWQQEKSEMANASEELRSKLQAEAEQRARLSHELETTQQKLHEVSEERDVLASDLGEKVTNIEDMIRQRGLLEEKLQISQFDGNKLAKKVNQSAVIFSALQQKLEDIETENAATLSKMSVDMGLMTEVQEGQNSLEAEVLTFAKEVNGTEEDVQTMEMLGSQEQILSDENHKTLLTKLDQYSRNRNKEAHESQLVRKELAQLKLILDEANKTKEQIIRDYDSYKLETGSAIFLKQQYEAEVMKSRQQIDELNLQILHLKDELNELKDENLKLTGEFDECKLLGEKVEIERADLSNDLHLVRMELEQMRREAEFHKTLEKERNQLIEENNKLAVELQNCKEWSSKMHSEQLEHNNCLKGVILQLHKATHESMHLTGNLHKHTHLLAEVSAPLQSQADLLPRECSVQENSLVGAPDDIKSVMHHAVETLEESIRPSECNSESHILNIDSELAAAVSATIKNLAEFRILQDERVSAVRELTSTCGHLKKLVQLQDRMSEGSEGLLNHLRDADGNEDGENMQTPMALNILVDDCGKFVKQLQEGLSERSQHEATIRELESALFIKDKDIKDINGKYVELSLKCGQIEEISGKCTILDEKCANMEKQIAQLADERDSLHLEVDALQKSLLEKDMLMKTSAGSYDDLKCQFDMAIEKLIAFIEETIQDEMLVADPCSQRISYLETSLLLLIKKYKASLHQVNLFQKSLFELASSYGFSWENEPTMPLDGILREFFSCKEKELTHSYEKLDEMTSIKNQQEAEIRELRDALCKTEENLKEVKLESCKFRNDLDQIETKLSSVREKLSLAVSKGKGLVQQRDALKQSLIDKSNELEKCLQEWQMKNDALHADEMKASERVKALEPELADVKNSVNNFQQSSSVIQKIENLEEVNFPEDLRPKELIDKIEWLARTSAEENASYSSSRDWKISEGSDTNVADYKSPETIMDGEMIKESNGDDLKTKFEELQDKYRSLVEQLGMMEQSLSERDNLIQRWESLLNSIDLPASLQSFEVESKIEWLCRALSQAQQDVAHFEHEIENLKNFSNITTFELEESKRRIISLEENLLKEKQEKEVFLKNIEELNCKYESSTLEASQKESSCKELVDRQVEVFECGAPLEHNVVDKNSAAEDCIRRIVDIVSETMNNHDFEELSSNCNNEEDLEGCVRKLINKINTLSEEVKMLKEADNAKTEELQSLQAVLDEKSMILTEMNEKQENASSTVASHRAEIDSLMEQNRIMSNELVTIKDQKDALKVQLEEAEERSALIREKLTMAVKKGKGLVQQRDNLKQSMDEKLSELEHLKAELQARELALNEHKERIGNMSIELEHFESEKIDIISLRKRCTELEKSLLDSNNMMQRLMNSVEAIEFPVEVSSRDPIGKIEWLDESLHQLRQKISIAEEEAKNCKGEADIFATKLDKACETICNREDELSNSENKISMLTIEIKAKEAESSHEIQAIKDVLAARTVELNEVHIRVDDQISELSKQHALLRILKKEYGCLLSLLANDFPKKLNILRSMELSFQDILSQLDSLKGIKLPGTKIGNQQTSATVEFYQEGKLLNNGAVVETYTEEYVDYLLHDNNLHGGRIVDELVSYLGCGLNSCTEQLEFIKDRFGLYCNAVEQGTTVLSQLLQCTRGDVVFLVESLESLKQNVASLEALNKEKDNEILLLNDNFATLVNVCKNAMEELQDLKLQIISDSTSSGEEVAKSGSNYPASENSHVMELAGHDNLTFPGECVKTAENLSFIIKDVANAANENSKRNQREVSNLKSKCQNAEMEAEQLRGCKELESKLVRVEAVADDIARERDVAKARICELESYVASLENNNHALESHVKEFQTCEASMRARQEELATLHDGLSTKNQELEDLHKQVQELENNCQQKHAALESLESSQGKSLSELSDMRSRFEELRQLSEGLVGEVENLHLQLESRDEEITQLKDEAIKSTHDILALLENIITKLGLDPMLLEPKGESQMQALFYTLDEKVSGIISESESSRADAQTKDLLLQSTQNSVEELSDKVERLEASLREKETQFEIFQLEKHPQPVVDATEVSEIEELGQSSKTPLLSVPVAPHVRSTRKASSNHLALDIDVESDALAFDREDHDKGHAFKSLTTTGFIPKSTQPVADWIDGIWVSGGRILMRQPTARMGLIVYWLTLHLWIVAMVL